MSNKNRNMSEENLGNASGGVGMNEGSNVGQGDVRNALGGHIQQGYMRVPDGDGSFKEPLAYRVIDSNGNASGIIGSLASAQRYASENGISQNVVETNTVFNAQ